MQPQHGNVNGQAGGSGSGNRGNRAYQNRTNARSAPLNGVLLIFLYLFFCL